MKTIRRIQNVVVVVAMATAISLADGVNVTGKEIWSCSVILVLVVLMVVYRALNEENKKEVE